MDSIGTAANRALQQVTKAGRVSLLQKLAKQARKEPNGMPVLVDLEVDLKFQILICFRHNNGAIELRRPLDAEERTTIEARRTTLELAIEPYFLARANAGVATVDG